MSNAKLSIVSLNVEEGVRELLASGASNEEIRKLAKTKFGMNPADCTITRWRKRLGVKAKTVMKRCEHGHGRDSYFDKDEQALIERYKSLFAVMKPKEASDCSV